MNAKEDYPPAVLYRLLMKCNSITDYKLHPKIRLRLQITDYFSNVGSITNYRLQPKSNRDYRLLHET